jgi:hypothetical protein
MMQHGQPQFYMSQQVQIPTNLQRSVSYANVNNHNMSFLSDMNDPSLFGVNMQMTQTFHPLLPQDHLLA